MIDACNDHPNDAIHRSIGENADNILDLGQSQVGLSIISVVQTCFEGLTDPAYSFETRRLTLHNCQIATRLLRSALAVNAVDRRLAAPMHALALYEVRCEPLCTMYHPD